MAINWIPNSRWRLKACPRCTTGDQFWDIWEKRWHCFQCGYIEPVDEPIKAKVRIKYGTGEYATANSVIRGLR